LVVQPIECGVNLTRVETKSFKVQKKKKDNRGRPPVFTGEYAQFLIKYIDSNIASTVHQTHDELYKTFLRLKKYQSMQFISI
ncbi:hypothetical protein BCV72DRAFT_315664, partial [Rhizopus microsporus var. microsporus]